jgi:hypothetical protein
VSITNRVIEFESRAELDLAFLDGKLHADEIFHTLRDDRRWKLDITGRGFVEVEGHEETHVFIWWMNNWGLMATFSIMEQADGGNRDFPVLPGHLKMALRQAENTQQYRGQLIPPVTLQAVVDTELLEDVQGEDTLQAILTNGYFGIPFEITHYDVVKKYAGIITTPELKVPDTCVLREQLKG